MADDDYGAPISYLVLAKGTPVFSSDGERLGVVEHVLADAEDDIFDGIIIDTSEGPGGWRFADAAIVDAIHERGVVLSCTAAECASLPEPSENPAAVDHHGVEDSEGGIQHKLRRAWDYISGNY